MGEWDFLSNPQAQELPDRWYGGNIDEYGATDYQPGWDKASEIQNLSNRIAQRRNTRLTGEAEGMLSQGLMNLQTYRPGGVAALTSPFYSQMAQVHLSDRQGAPDLMHQYRVRESEEAKKAAKRAGRMQLAGSLIGSAARIGAAAMTGGGSEVAVAGLNAAGAGMQNTQGPGGPGPAPAPSGPQPLGHPPQPELPGGGYGMAGPPGPASGGANYPAPGPGPGGPGPQSPGPGPQSPGPGPHSPGPGAPGPGPGGPGPHSPGPGGPAPQPGGPGPQGGPNAARGGEGPMAAGMPEQGGLYGVPGLTDQHLEAFAYDMLDHADEVQGLDPLTMFRASRARITQVLEDALA